MLRKLNHPSFAKLNWVYYTKPTFFKDKVNYTPQPNTDTKLKNTGNEKEQFDLKMQNQLDWVHMVTDYYPEGSLNDLLMRKGNTLKEYEIQKIAKSLLSAISCCHTELGIVHTNLNPDSIAVQFKEKMYHTRLINLSHHFKGTHKNISQ